MAFEFPPKGLVYFWFLNNDGNMDDLRRQIKAFAQANVDTIVLHPRTGLLVPFLGGDWFDLTRTLTQELAKEGISVWLYDENYCPSGSCEGWITAEHPEWAARAIERNEAPADLKTGELFLFPTGKLLWVGAVPPEGVKASPIDLTDRVGMIRRHWEVSPWDSRWYYPTTPLYDCPRSLVYIPEYGLRKPEIPAGWKLVAFVARPVGRDSGWGSIADSLNPDATQEFLRRGYEPYARSLGDMLGREVTAMFTDEPKYHSPFPYTDGLFESFQETYGYDLRPRLEMVLSGSSVSEAVLTRIHFRQWCGQRFREAWLKPIAKWCKDHNLYFVGHISPEDDLVQQAMCVSNLFPLQKDFDMAGLDLIIPAVGDEKHAIINVGVTLAVSASQQNQQIGVISETLGASGVELDTRKSARILAWQVVSGVSTVVIHGAFASTLGLRVFDAGPDYGPDSPRWEGMCDTDAGLRPFVPVISNTTQIAPVAILWPIRSFHIDAAGWVHEDVGKRKNFQQLLLACLQSQVGVQLLDEEGLWEAKLQEQILQLGRARYSTVLIPETTVLHERTLAKLREFTAAGGRLFALGAGPQWVQKENGIEKLDHAPWQAQAPTDLRAWCRQHLPRLLPLGEQDLPDLRASTWESDGQRTTLAVNISDSRDGTMELGSQKFPMYAGSLISLQQDQAGKWQELHRFETSRVRPQLPPPPSLPWAGWEVRYPQGEWRPLDRPRAVYEIHEPWKNAQGVVHMILTGSAPLTKEPAAEYMEYRGRLQIESAPDKARLVLEPTSIRGRLTISVNGSRFDVNIDDLHTEPVILDVGQALAAGEHEIRFQVHQPRAFDGIKSPPLVRID